ncbi:MAG: hypothetical protein JO369_07845 [Paucibacter sp.]|nr:hypothetical protein [Roseateles sp.]
MKLSSLATAGLFRLLLPLLAAFAVLPPASAATTRELTPPERHELETALADGGSALALDAGSARVFAQRTSTGWSYAGWVDSRAEASGGVCKRLRYGLARAAGAARWRLDPHAESYWSIGGITGTDCARDPVHLIGPMDEALFKRIVPHALELLRDASLVVRGNTLCARETIAGMQLYELGAQVDARGRGEALLAYAPAVSSTSRIAGRWSLALRFRVTPDDITPLAASCEDLGNRPLH